jgi:type IV pilus assembly protein PilO
MQISFSISKLPWQAQLGIVATVSVLSAGSFYFLYVEDTRASLAARQTQLDALRNDIRKGQAIGRTLPQFQAQVKDLEGRLEGLKPVLPETKDVGDLLRRIQTLAAQSNLQIKGFTPKAVTTRQLHAEWPIVLQLDGTYHNLGTFFDKISKFPRIINIGELNIKAKENPDATSTVTAECMAMTFVLLETPAAAPTTGTNTPPCRRRLGPAGGGCWGGGTGLGR